MLLRFVFIFLKFEDPISHWWVFENSFLILHSLCVAGWTAFRGDSENIAFQRGGGCFILCPSRLPEIRFQAYSQMKLLSPALAQIPICGFCCAQSLLLAPVTQICPSKNQRVLLSLGYVSFQGIEVWNQNCLFLGSMAKQFLKKWPCGTWRQATAVIASFLLHRHHEEVLWSSKFGSEFDG